MIINYHAISPSAARKDPRTGEPIEAFKGFITCGIRFENHEATFNDLTVKKDLGLTAEQVAAAMVNDFGYRVMVVDEDRSESPFVPSKAAAAKPKAKAAAAAEA